MYSDNQEDIKKKIFKIGEVASYLGLNVSKIRFWSEEFNINPQTNKRGVRFYNEDEFELLEIIYSLVEKRGYTLDGAKKYLKDNKKIERDKLRAVKSIAKVKEFLLNIKKEIKSKF